MSSRFRSCRSAASMTQKRPVADGCKQLASPPSPLPLPTCGSGTLPILPSPHLHSHGPPPAPPPTPLTYFPSNCDANAHRLAPRPQVRGRRSPSETRKLANCPHNCLTDERSEKKKEGTTITFQIRLINTTTLTNWNPELFGALFDAAQRQRPTESAAALSVTGG